MSRERGEKPLSRHHRLPRSLGGGDSDRNISIVKVSEHNGWHNAFGTRSPCEVAKEINQKWIPKQFTFVPFREGGVKKCTGCPWHKKCSLEE